MSIITLNTRSLPDSAVTTAKINADAVTDAKIADDVIGTEHLTAGEVDATALGADSVTAAKINDDIISGSTELASEPADTDEFLVSDAGTLKRIDYSLIKGGGIDNIQQWTLDANTSFSGSGSKILSGFTINTNKFTTLGSAMSESSGIWTFPSTGYWMITPHFYMRASGGSRSYVGAGLQTTNDNSAYIAVLSTYGSAYTNSAYSAPNFVYIMDVTNTTNDKMKIWIEGEDTILAEGGGSNYDKTGVKFLRLGDT